MRKRYLMQIAMLCALFLVLTGSHTQAVNYDREIREEEKKQKSFEKKAAGLQKEIQEIEKVREKSLVYIEKLDKKTGELEESLEELGKKIAKANTELKTADRNLKQAQEEEQKQYITMKKRIKYMYENGNGEYWQIIFGATSMSSLLGRSEYVEKISNYDNRIFTNFRKIKSEVSAQEKDLQRRRNELLELESETRTEKQYVTELKKKKKAEIKKYNKKLDSSQERADEYIRQAIDAENKVEELLQKKQEEIDREQGVEGDDSDEAASHSGLRWPLSGGAGRISSSFGPRKSPRAGASSYHRGVDLAIASGTPVLAAGSGRVVTSTYSSSAGNYIMISHGKRLYTVYMHCSRRIVKAGDSVSKGQVIGYVGSTGISTGPHLHFGVSKNGTYVNPLNYVSR